MSYRTPQEKKLWLEGFLFGSLFAILIMELAALIFKF